MKTYRNELTSLYKRDFRFESSKCAYCDAPRQCLDHAPPLRVASDMDIIMFKKTGGELLLIPSCNDCNILLSDLWLFDYDERLSKLYYLYLDKIKKSAEWTNEELDELGWNLRNMIEARQRRREELKQKLENVSEKLRSSDFH